MMRDLIAVLRDFSNEDYERTKEVLAPYRGDPEKELELTRELVEIVSSFAETAENAGLPAGEMLAHFVSQVPTHLRPSYQRVADLILSVKAGTSASRTDVVDDSFIKAMLNTGTWLVRQLALKARKTEAEMYHTTALILAGADEEGTSTH
jgi:hypothetical protein